MTKNVTYTTKNLTEWTETRRGEIELDAIARACLGNAEITDRDRIAFALRELRKRGYDAEACPVDWTKPLMICSMDDAKWGSFGEPSPSKLYKRLELIAKRYGLHAGDDLEIEPDGDVLRLVPMLRVPRHRPDGDGDHESQALESLRRYHAELGEAIDRADRQRQHEHGESWPTEHWAGLSEKTGRYVG